MRREGGFTLLEVLVALVVLGFVVAGLTQGLRFGLQATARQERFTAERGDIDAVDRLLRRLLTQMDPGTSRTPTAVAGGRSSVAFVTDLGAAAAQLGGTDAQVRLGVEGGRLVLSWRPAPHVVRLGPPPPMRTATLLDGLERVEFAYWGAVGKEAPGWKRDWQGTALPSLVRVRLLFPEKGGRQWPDIVAGPARPRPTS